MANELYKGKHLRIECRLIIEYGLNQNFTSKEIAERVKADSTTIFKKIKRNSFVRVSNKKESDLQTCQNQRSCTKINFIEDNPNIPVVEMNTVHETRSSKVLLIFFFRNC